MRDCDACGLPLSDVAFQCPRCDWPVDGHLHSTNFSGGSAGHLQQARLSGDSGRIPTLTLTRPAAVRPTATRDVPSSPVSADVDPEETTRFRPVVPSYSNVKNTVALFGLSAFLVAAVSSLALLIGQSVSTGTPMPRSAPTTGPTAISTAVPKGATVCTHEVARSNNTSCTDARRVLSAFRKVGADVPEKFRLIVVHPSTKKNSTYKCEVKGWVECVSDQDATVYVRRQV